MLIACSLPDVMLKVRDEHNNPVLDYGLFTGFKPGARGGGGIGRGVELTNDVWYRKPYELIRPGAEGNIRVSTPITSEHPESAEAETNIIMRADAETIYVTLIMTPPKSKPETELYASGWLKYENGMPVTQGWVVAGEAFDRPSSAADRARTFDRCVDDAGWFEVYGTATPDKPVFGMTAGYLSDGNHINYQTNVVKGTTDMIWFLPCPRYIKGRVCIGNHDTPATNFLVDIVGNTSDTITNSDGRFETPIAQHNHHLDAQFNLVVIECPPFAPVHIHFDDIRGTMLDVGDIVLTAPASSLYGRVLSRDGGPIAADVSLRSPDLPLDNIYVKYGCFDQTTRTDDMQGEYDFTGLSTGRYSIVATSGNVAATNTVTITRFGETVTMPDLILDTAAPE
jgi:hypothetical protein